MCHAFRADNQPWENGGPGPAIPEHNTAPPSHHHMVEYDWNMWTVSSTWAAQSLQMVTGQRDHLQDPESQPSHWQTVSEIPAAEVDKAINPAEDIQSRSPFFTLTWL